MFLACYIQTLVFVWAVRLRFSSGRMVTILDTRDNVNGSGELL